MRCRDVTHLPGVAGISALQRALVNEMPHTLAALECGMLSEWRATLIVRESACLEVEDRRTLDAELCGDPAGLNGMGDARVAAPPRRSPTGWTRTPSSIGRPRPRTNARSPFGRHPVHSRDVLHRQEPTKPQYRRASPFYRAGLFSCQVPWMVVPVIFMPPTSINRILMAWMMPLSQVAAVLADGRQPFAVGMAVIAHGGRLMGGCS